MYTFTITEEELNWDCEGMTIKEFVEYKKKQQRENTAEAKAALAAKLKAVNDLVGKVFFLDFNQESYRIFYHDTPLKHYDETLRSKVPILHIVDGKTFQVDGYNYIRTDWIFGTNIKAAWEVPKEFYDMATAALLRTCAELIDCAKLHKPKHLED